MTIAVLIDNRNKVYTFPKLMVHEDGGVVLFTSMYVGTCVSPGRGCMTGEYSGAWNPSDFKDYGGSITLSNGG